MFEVGSYFQVQVQMALGSITRAMNVWHYQVVDNDNPTAQDFMDAVATRIGNIYQGYLGGMVSGNVHGATAVFAVWNTATEEFTTAGEAVFPFDGTAGSDPLPPQAALYVKLPKALGSRPGGKRVFGLVEGHQDSGVLATDRVAAAITWGTVMANQLQASDARCNPQVFIPALKKFQPMAGGAVADNVIDSCRTRKSGKGW